MPGFFGQVREIGFSFWTAGGFPPPTICTQGTRMSLGDSYKDACGRMNLYKIEQLKAEAIARCRKRLELHGKTDVILPSNPPSPYALRQKHGL